MGPEFEPVRIRIQSNGRTIDRDYDPHVVRHPGQTVSFISDNALRLVSVKKACGYAGCPHPSSPFVEALDPAFTRPGQPTRTYTIAPEAKGHVYKVTYRVDTDQEDWDPHIIVVDP